MFTRILVAIDGSMNSDAALDEALAITRDQHAKLRIVHVIDRRPRAIGPILPDLEAFAAAAVEAGHRVTASAQEAADAAGVDAEVVLAEIGRCPCPLSSKVLSEAADFAAGLIVIGAEERTGLRRRFSEGVEADVAHLAQVPVLVVHRQGHAWVARSVPLSA